MSKDKKIDFNNITKSELEELINERIIGKFAYRNRNIVYRRLIDGILFEDLAEEFELSVTRVKDIVYECQRKIFR